MTLFIEQQNYSAVQNEKIKVEKALKKAMEYAASELLPVRQEKERLPEVFQTAFFEAFYIYMGVMEDIEGRQMLQMYFPLLVLVEEDGAFFYYAKEIEQEGKIELTYQWSEQIIFEFSSDSTEAMKKNELAKYLERYASEIITNYNYIAKQYGINYTFFVPDFLQDTSQTLEFPMLFAVFQGWPLTASGDIVYENCFDAGAYIQEVKKYVIELPQNLSDTFCYFHKESCEKVQTGVGNFLKERYSKEQAIKKYGAIACECCEK